MGFIKNLIKELKKDKELKKNWPTKKAFRQFYIFIGYALMGIIIGIVILLILK